MGRVLKTAATVPGILRRRVPGAFGDKFCRPPCCFEILCTPLDQLTALSVIGFDIVLRNVARLISSESGARGLITRRRLAALGGWWVLSAVSFPLVSSILLHIVPFFLPFSTRPSLPSPPPQTHLRSPTSPAR
ncbi:hypothetical protein PHLGIDRAFT_482673 [Phlebiopsis gigantea 11061_1 CR5-6]|uniref:Uncharacterized protein n=1 Tax=Phlebiopsis gigantea (strain 11061_1 CR5-6) TaxID=745531 RepID=A0A0C3S603_PHLG1|nr:hypothetical protein PHLGIDRAFT_482673 [Phlebiopsis gigantea 11061_1 CR5-6]